MSFSTLQHSNTPTLQHSIFPLSAKKSPTLSQHRVGLFRELNNGKSGLSRSFPVCEHIHPTRRQTTTVGTTTIFYKSKCVHRII